MKDSPRKRHARTLIDAMPETQAMQDAAECKGRTSLFVLIALLLLLILAILPPSRFAQFFAYTFIPFILRLVLQYTQVSISHSHQLFI
jgi:hypothetical protein